MKLSSISKYGRHSVFFVLSVAGIVIILHIFTQQSLHRKSNFSSESNGQLTIPLKHGLNEDSTQFLLPDDTTLKTLKDTQLLEIYWSYINTIQVLCRNQRRLGSLKDGGKEVCVDNLYKPQHPCLVYSFGSRFQFDFEVDVIRNYKCEVHTFDPSKPIKNRPIPKGIHFHLVGLWSKSVTGRNRWRMETLSSIRQKLNHADRVIDVLKIDIEGGEWTALPEIFQSGVLKISKYDRRAVVFILVVLAGIGATVRTMYPRIRTLTSSSEPESELRIPQDGNSNHEWKEDRARFILPDDNSKSEPKSQLTIPLDGNTKHGLNEDSSPFLLPDDTTLATLKENQLLKIYWRYINTLQVLCRNQMRLGSLKDGGKEVCVDNLYKPRHPCLVYSFGSNFQYDFEVDVIRNYKCEIHTFDPSKPIKNRPPPSGIHFHMIGLWNMSTTGKKGWRMESLSSIREHLNHTYRIIDILKIDVERAEWIALPEIIQSGVLQYVKQICIEVHVGRKKKRDYVNVTQQLSLLRKLYEQGFHIFMREHNLSSLSKRTGRVITVVNEISLVNTNFKDIL